MNTDVKNLIRKIKEYVNTENKAQKSLLLVGNWGIGKTYFITNSIFKNNEIDGEIISLFGLSSIDELINTLYAKLFSKRSKAIKFFEIAGSFLGGMTTQINKNVALELAVPNLPSHYWFAKRKLNKQMKLTQKRSKFLIVLDDLDRTQINLLSLYGLINNLITLGFKVMTICNTTNTEMWSSIRSHDAKEMRSELFKPEQREKIFNEPLHLPNSYFCYAVSQINVKLYNELNDPDLLFLTEDAFILRITKLVKSSKKFSLNLRLYLRLIDIFKQIYFHLKQSKNKTEIIKICFLLLLLLLFDVYKNEIMEEANSIKRLGFLYDNNDLSGDLQICSFIFGNKQVFDWLNDYVQNKNNGIIDDDNVQSLINQIISAKLFFAHNNILKDHINNVSNYISQDESTTEQYITNFNDYLKENSIPKIDSQNKMSYFMRFLGTIVNFYVLTDRCWDNIIENIGNKIANSITLKDYEMDIDINIYLFYKKDDPNYDKAQSILSKMKQIILKKPTRQYKLIQGKDLKTINDWFDSNEVVPGQSDFIKNLNMSMKDLSEIIIKSTNQDINDFRLRLQNYYYWNYLMSNQIDVSEESKKMLSELAEELNKRTQEIWDKIKIQLIKWLINTQINRAIYEIDEVLKSYKLSRARP